MTRASLLTGGSCALLGATAVPHVFVDGTERAVSLWLERHDAYAERARQGGIQLLFLGDSLTYAWNFDGAAVWASDFASLEAVSFGIGGDRTGDVLWRVEHGELDGSGAATVVLEIGTNDLGTGSSAATTTAGVEACVRAIRAKLPQATVVVMSILPRGRGDAASGLHPLVAEVNARLAQLDDGKRVRFVDFTAAFSDEDGVLRAELYHADLLHLSAAGYRAWSDTLRPALARLRR